MTQKDEQLNLLQKKVDRLDRQDQLPDTGESFRIDKDVFIKQAYFVEETDVGDLFLKFQHRSTVLVNKLRVKATMDNLPKFL
jgi:hypothetical protein